MSGDSATGPVGEELDRRRLLWRCRRGMKELDILLARFARACVAQASAAERLAFAALLELPDPKLAAYLLGHELPGDPALARLVARIARGAPASGDWS